MSVVSALLLEDGMLDRIMESTLGEILVVGSILLIFFYAISTIYFRIRDFFRKRKTQVHGKGKQ